VLGVLFVVALVIPLVVFSGGGENAAEPTPAPVTTLQTAATAPRTTTRERSATTTTSRTTTEAATLRVTLPEGAALSRGDRGTAVVQLQKGLAALGFAVGQPDGVFGATTEAAVVDFQQSNNLSPDGVVGTDTVRLLNAALTKKGATG
jgi:N-acetylmuramoyl-L-alanine amidase